MLLFYLGCSPRFFCHKKAPVLQFARWGLFIFLESFAFGRRQLLNTAIVEGIFLGVFFWHLFLTCFLFKQICDMHKRYSFAGEVTRVNGLAA